MHILEVGPGGSADDIVRIAAAGKLFRAYADELDFSLDFQDFEEELKGLPGAYAPPGGRLYLAGLRKASAGCVALQAIDGHVCEMKRLYVLPRYRRQGLGRWMSLELIRAAVSIGYARMRLDTIDTMTPALCLYHDLGFREIEPYRYNPIPGATFLELDLRGWNPLGAIEEDR